MRLPTALAFTIMILTACEKDSLGIDDGADDTGDALCIDLGPAASPAIDAIGCVTIGDRFACDLAVYVEPGHRADFAIIPSGFGEQPWNELPFDAEAGMLESAYLVGEGWTCATTSLAIEPIGTLPDGSRAVTFVIEDTTLGLFTDVTVAVD